MNIVIYKIMEFISAGGDTKLLESEQKNKWNWNWLSEIDSDGDKWELCFSKPNISGKAYCEYCEKFLNYGSSGKKALKKHAETSNHKWNKSWKTNQNVSEEDSPNDGAVTGIQSERGDSDLINGRFKISGSVRPSNDEADPPIYLEMEAATSSGVTPVKTVSFSENPNPQKSPPESNVKPGVQKTPNKKRDYKNSFGVQKKRGKMNNKESAADMSGFSKKVNQGKPGKQCTNKNKKVPDESHKKSTRRGVENPVLGQPQPQMDPTVTPVSSEVETHSAQSHLVVSTGLQSFLPEPSLSVPTLFTPISSVAPVSFPAERMLTPLSTQKEIQDLLNSIFDESVINTTDFT